MNLNKVIQISIGLIIFAIVVPLGLTTLVDSQLNQEFSDTDTAVQNSATEEVITVSVTPYITDTVAVTVNAVVITAFTETSSTLGTVTLGAAQSDVDDVIVTTYDALATGVVTTIWELLPLIVGIGLFLGVVGWVGLRRLRR